MAKKSSAAFKVLSAKLADRGINVTQTVRALKAQRIETPSWGFADSGTRFKVFKQPGAASTVFEKLDDAAQVQKYTGITPTVAIHVPWDKMDDYSGMLSHARKLGLTIGAVNPNLFQEPEYKLGSITHADPKVRRKAVAHMLECIDIAREVGSNALSLWFADGTNYPGQGNFRKRKQWAVECLAKVYRAMPPKMRMLLEYKLFEPGFYHTDIMDWGMSCVMCQQLGPKAQVLVDLGHHALGTNIEHIVAFLIDEGRLGGFHFNNKKYADDDLTTGSINPYELFLIYNELVAAELDPKVKTDVAYMIDQSHNIKPKIEAVIQSVVNCQVSYAKALIVDRKTLEQARDDGDVVLAEETLVAAYQTDVEPLLVHVREAMGVPAEPLCAFRSSGYLARVEAERSR